MEHAAWQRRAQLGLQATASRQGDYRLGGSKLTYGVQNTLAAGTRHF
jgi:hypothetical protein